MTPPTSPPKTRPEVAKLERRLAEIEVDLDHLERDRTRVRQALEVARQGATMCPRCGRDRDFLADVGGFLGHVLEDPDDDENLEPGKPLFCPACGDVFLYAPTPPASPPTAAKEVAPGGNGRKRAFAVPMPMGTGRRR